MSLIFSYHYLFVVVPFLFPLDSIHPKKEMHRMAGPLRLK